MNTLTQVWVFSLAICSFILISSFKFAGRLGLFIGFLVSLLIIYLLLHKGLKVFLDQIKAQLHKGSDPTGLNALLNQYKLKYPIDKYFLYYTENISHPLVWRDFKNDVHIILNRPMVEKLTSDEKKLLAHLMLSHAVTHSKLRRRLCSIIYLALSPGSIFTSPVFNFSSGLLGLQKQIFKADLLALSISESNTQELKNDFSLFLRKIHNLNFHQTKYYKGENYFSILSTSASGLFNLKLAPKLDIRLKNLTGERHTN